MPNTSTRCPKDANEAITRMPSEEPIDSGQERTFSRKCIPPPGKSRGSGKQRRKQNNLRLLKVYKVDPMGRQGRMPTASRKTLVDTFSAMKRTILISFLASALALPSAIVAQDKD